MDKKMIIKKNDDERNNWCGFKGIFLASDTQYKD